MMNWLKKQSPFGRKERNKEGKEENRRRKMAIFGLQYYFFY